MTCPLCKAIATEPEEEGSIEAYPGSMTFDILETKDKKGHSHRFMIVAREHTNHVSSYEEATAKAFLFRFMMLNIGLGRSDRGLHFYDFAILERTHATIPEHWHIVASSLDDGSDQEKILDTDRIEVRFKSRETNIE